MKKSLLITFSFCLILFVISLPIGFGQTYHALSSGSYSQDWTNADLITTNDDWSGVASIRGFRGDNWTAATGVDPQTVLTHASPVIDVNANQTDGGTFSTGGVTEFSLTDPVVGFAGSGTADAPCLVIYINSTGLSNIKIKYDLRDIDGSVDDAVQAVALQYRNGDTGDFINIPGGFVADASTGPSLASLVTHVDVQLPSACNNLAQLQLRIITTNAGGNDEYIGIDNIVVEVDAAPPIASFNPANAETGVLVNAIPVITFDEPILKTDGSVVSDADLASLVAFKETDGSGTAVAFAATIDAAKKVITVTPSANLKNAQAYYLAVGPVEDASGNESTLKSAVFTTISATTPTITLVYPNGGERLYSGDQATITWTTTNFDAAENVKIEVYLPEAIWYTLEASTPNDGSQVVNVGPKADYGTSYLIRVSGVTNGATDQSDNPFTVIATANTLADLRGYDANSIIKYTGAATVTYARTSNNQKYIQDATAAILIHDPSNYVGTYAAGSGITNVEGKLTLYNGLLELVPQAATGATTTGPTITPPEMTLTQYNANYLNYESELIKLTDVYFPTANGSLTFPSSNNVNLTDGTTTIVFRTFATGESDIVGSVIPTSHIKMTCIGGFFNTTVQVYSRTTNDFELLTGIEKRSASDNIRLYPVPATSILNVSGVPNLKSVEILDIAGKVISSVTTSSDEVIRIPVSNLRQGTYLLRFNTTDGNIIKKFVR